jgi:hypothetical protein
MAAGNRPMRTTMKYGIDYRLLAKDGKSLVDNTTMHRAVDVEVDETQFALIPNVGDYVDFPGEDDIRHVPLKGKVRSRCFNYKLGYCYVTVVIEETADADWTCVHP